MPTGETLNPPTQYSSLWLFIGLAVLAILPIWYLVLVWLTRRKQYKAYQNFSKLPQGVDSDLLKARYLHLVDKIYERYTKRSITLREMHRQLSITLRYFVYEAKRVPAPTMTLADLQLVPYPVLTELVTQYYAQEFGIFGRSDARATIETAKGFITKWG